MNDWYRIDQIHEKLYMITEDKHWEETHMYYIIGQERNILLDSGTGLFGIKEICRSIDDKDIDLIISHCHWDHIGNVDEFKRVLCHPLDGQWLIEGIPIPEKALQEMLIKDVDQTYLDLVKKPLKSPKIPSYDRLEAGQIIEGYQVIHTPGHSPGHCVLYDAKRKLLLAGDIIYKGTIYCHFESTDPKELYKSYKRLNQLDIINIYSGNYKVPLEKDVLEDLLEILESFNEDSLLVHGSGLRKKNDVGVMI